MPSGIPNHNDPITFDKGKWVPVGWKPLNTSAKTRQMVLGMIAKKKYEADNKELQRNVIQRRKEEKRELKKRAIEELDRIDQEIADLREKKKELAEAKHAQFAELKTIFAREAQLKKIEEEKKRREEAINQLLNPAYAKQPAVQSNSLISQQFLTAPQLQQYHQPHQSNQYHSMQILNTLRQQQHQQQQMTSAGKQISSLIPPQQTHTPQMRSGLIPPAAQSPFYSGGSNYASPAPSRNYIPGPQSVNSPRRDRPPMASPGTKFAPQPQPRHNSFVGGTRPEQVRAAESPAIPVTTQLNLQDIQRLALQQGLSVAAGLLTQQHHQPTPPPQAGLRR